jgi:hypothetical protein
MTHRPFGLPRLALLATALTFIWFQPLLLAQSEREGLAQGAAPSELSPSGATENSPACGERCRTRHQPRVTKSARSANRSAEGAFSFQREALSFFTLRVSAQFDATSSPESLQSPFTIHSIAFSQAPSQTGSMTEIRALFAEFLKLHAAKKMDEWRDKMFLSEAVCFRTSPDGQVAVFPVAELARTIAEEAKSLDEQHETFEDVRIEVHGNAAQYATSWTLFHNGKVARKGRAFFSLVKKEGAWKIASLVWYRE